MAEKLFSILLGCVVVVTLVLIGSYERTLSLASIEKKELIEKNRKVSELYQKTNSKLQGCWQERGLCSDKNKMLMTKCGEMFIMCKDIIENKKNCYRAEYLEREK